MGIYEDQQIHTKTALDQSDFNTAGPAPRLTRQIIISYQPFQRFEYRLNLQNRFQCYQFSYVYTALTLVLYSKCRNKIITKLGICALYLIKIKVMRKFRELCKAPHLPQVMFSYLMTMYLHFRMKKNYLQRCNFTLILSIENVDKEFRKCEGESIRWGLITDEHRKAITLSATDKWEKTVDLKEPSRKEDNLIIKSQRS